MSAPKKALPGRRLVIITDVGPDPDDAKALLVAGVFHLSGSLELCAVVANGGAQPEMRARLARCVLDHVGVGSSVPVGIGSMGTPYAAQPHEYSLAGFEQVEARELADGKALLMQVFRQAKRRSLTVVCISSLRDFADLIDEAPSLVLDKALEVVIQGGIEPADTPTGWRADSSVNNTFDLPAADRVYSFCFEHGLPLAIVSRNAVPLLPMQLAKSFADRTSCSLLRYLADAQFLGLEGLWQKLCQGKLPPRCSKQWFFETFCGVEKGQFERLRYEELGADHAIKQNLDGFVKPYDVLALMAALPQTRDIFRSGEDPGPKVGPVRGGSRGSSMLSAHRLLLRPSDTIDVRHVLQLLRDSYHEVVLASREREAHGRHQQHRQLAREQSSRPACGVVHGLQGELPPNGAKPHEPFAPKAVHGLCVARPSAQTRSSLGSNPLSPGHAVNANKAHIASWSLAGAPAPANTTAKPARREHSSWLGRLAPRPARISPSASAAVACGVAPPTSASVALLVGPPLARQADPASKLPVAQLAEPNASGAFPASFHEQMTTSYFARQRHGFAGETGGNDAPQCVLPEDAIVSLLTRALSQAQARESYVSSTLAAVSWSAALLLLLVMLVDEAVVLAGDAAYDEDLVELTLAAPGRWHLYHAVIMLATSFALVMLVLQQTNTRRVRLAAVMVSVQSALQACAFVGLLARSAIVAVRSGSGGALTRTATSSGTTDSVSRLAVYLAAEALSAALLAAAAFLVARAAVREQRLQCTNVVRSAVHAQLFQLVLDAFAVVSVVQAFAFVAKLGVDLMADGVEGSFSRLTVGAVVADIAASLLAPCVLRMPSFRQASQDVLNGLFWSAGAHAPLAALIGFGTSLIQEPARVVSEAMASFEPVVLDVRAFRLLDFHDARSGIGMAGGRASESASDASFSGSRPAGGAAHPDPSALEKVEVNLDVLAALERGRDSQGERNQRGSAQSHGAPAGASGALPKVGSGGSMAASLNAGNGRDVSPLAPSRRHNMALESMLASVAARLHDGEMAGNAADFYVVHSPVDHPEDRKAALREMARAFTAKRGRQPSVWLDVLCADPLMAPLEQLQHLPTYMSRCSKLLVLCSPNVADSLRAVLEMYVWRASGGLPEDVECLLVAPRALTVAQRKQRWDATIAAFDTFHAAVMEVAAELPDVKERVTYAIRLATVTHFNEVIRSYMGLVQKAAAADAALLAQAAQGYTSSNSSGQHTSLLHNVSPASQTSRLVSPNNSGRGTRYVTPESSLRGRKSASRIAEESIEEAVEADCSQSSSCGPSAGRIT